MEKGLFHDLYKRLEELDVRSYPLGQLSGLLHGYLLSLIHIFSGLMSDKDKLKYICPFSFVTERVFLYYKWLRNEICRDSQ